MKKRVIIALLLAVVMLFGFTACKQKESPVDMVTVTDENGEPVTDENGNAVTQPATTNASADTDTGTTAGGSAGGSGSGSGSGSGGSSQETTKPDTTKKDETTTKPKKREVTATVELPFYNNTKAVMHSAYKADGDSKYTYLDDVDVVFDGDSTVELELGKIKGDITVWVEFEGVDIKDNYFVITADKDNIVITPVTSIEQFWDMD